VSPQTPAPDAIDHAELIHSLHASVLQRIADADTEAHESDLAFAVGRFGEYFRQRGDEAERKIADEYDQIARPPTDEGNSEESG
jgi:hypothetical protein